MKKILIASLLVLTASAFAQVEFYGGDGDGRNGLASEKNGTITGGAWTFDNFDHKGGAITALWGNFLINYATAPTDVGYEIRSGVTAGNGGKLEASGKLTNPTYVATGRIYFAFTERYIKGGVSIPSLPAGRYWIGLEPRQTAAGRSFVSTTSGTDLGPTSDPNPPPTGTPLKDGNAFFNSAHFGVVFGPVSGQLGAGTWDFSYGVEIPEPTSLGLLAVGALALIRRR